MIFIVFLFSKFYILAFIFLFILFYLNYKTPLRITIYDNYIACKHVFFKKRYDFREVEQAKFSYGGSGAIRVLVIKMKSGYKVVLDETNLVQLVLILNLLHSHNIKVVKDHYWLKRIKFIDNTFLFD